MEIPEDDFETPSKKTDEQEKATSFASGRKLGQTNNCHRVFRDAYIHPADLPERAGVDLANEGRNVAYASHAGIKAHIQASGSFRPKRHAKAHKWAVRGQNLRPLITGGASDYQPGVARSRYARFAPS